MPERPRAPLTAGRDDARVVAVLRVAALASGGIVVLVLGFLALGAWPAVRSVGAVRFLTDDVWQPTGGRFGLGPMVVGTLASSGGALLIAAPLGLGSALFCRFYAPRPLAAAHRRLLGLLAGVPSVVFGFWGLIVLAPLIRAWQPPGQSLLAGSLILAVMVLPTVALLAEAALRAVPRASLDGAAALGLSRWATIRGVALPAARGGLFTAVLLATARALGETMAVLMVAGNVARYPDSVFDPVRTLTANIALELGYATAAHRSVLFTSGLLLMAMVVVLVALAARAAGGRVRA